MNISLPPAEQKTLVQTLWQSDKIWQRNIAIFLLGTLFLAICAHIQIPFYPVPVTMQSFGVLILGMALGSWLGGITLLVYFACGMIGLPVFAKTVGVAAFLSPTGGYLIGLFFAAILCGTLAERGFDRDVLLSALTCFLATIVIFLFGVVWLGSVIGWDKPVLAYGLFPFIPGAIFKISLATFLLPKIWKKIEKS